VSSTGVNGGPARARADKPSVGVVGGGPWGVALALAASRAGGEVVLHTRRQESHTQARVRTTTALADVAKARLIVIAVPSTVVREVVRALGDHLDGSHLVVHGIRGMSVEKLDSVSDVIRAETPARRLGALGGPVQASELLEGRPSAMVCGSQFPEVVEAATRAFQHGALRVYGTPDLRGLEWASALVGCLSVGVGFADEAGAGPGLLAALISRAVDEAARIAAASGADEKTMYGLGGYGDLLASIRLADRPEVVLGRALARGKSLEDGCVEAKLRVEAIALIPRVARFAKEMRLPAPTFDALVTILEGKGSTGIVERMFASG
jgi:glycerol-3-phosphate dehydrogenase (NAD(P)+)